MKLYRYLFFAMVIILSACSNPELKFFESSDKAIEYGIKDQKITHEEIIAEVDQLDERLIIFKKDLPEGVGIGFASVSKKGEKYTWYQADPLTLVKQNNVDTHPEIETIVKTFKGQEYRVHLGVLEDNNFPSDNRKKLQYRDQ
ncbi:hypothetical protein, partial [Anoxybacillus sp. KU2-6(11)]|uniref:hypothetical protein n=1 Tax=Anoxybacillus sp. KU2-6(11) TaxID=1535751 RepID=UPI000504C25C